MVAKGQKGMPILSHGIHMDVTELMSTREVLEDKDRRLNVIMDNLPEMLLVVNADGVYTEIRHSLECASYI